MKKNSKMPLSTLDGYEGKDSGFQNELQILYDYLLNRIVTASMLSMATGISHKNICRYKRQLEKANLLWEVERNVCKATGFKAWYITTNKDLVYPF
jgi:hypothetical protein